jgi:hypothetical protein
VRRAAAMQALQALVNRWSTSDVSVSCAGEWCHSLQPGQVDGARVVNREQAVGMKRGFDPAAFISHITMRICAPRRSEFQAIGIIVRSDSEGREGREGRERTLKRVGRRP